MRRIKLLPKNQEEFNRYAIFIKRLDNSTYITQAVSSVTEWIVFYAVSYARLSLHTSETTAHISAIVIATLVTALVEIGQRELFPESAKSFLDDRWKGLAGWISALTLGIAIILLAVSVFGSIVTVEKAVKLTAGNAATLPIDSLDRRHQTQKGMLVAQYIRDSVSYENNFGEQIAAKAGAYDAKVRAQETNKAIYKNRSDFTSESVVRRRIENLKSQRAGALTTLSEEKAAYLAGLLVRHQKDLDALNTKYRRSITKMESANEAAMIAHTSETKRFSWFGIVVIAFCQLWLVVISVMKAVFYKMAGIEHRVVPDQYYFEPSAWSEIVMAVNSWWNYSLRFISNAVTVKKIPLHIRERTLPELVDFSQLMQGVTHYRNDSVTTSERNAENSVTTRSNAHRNGDRGGENNDPRNENRNERNDRPVIQGFQRETQGPEIVVIDGLAYVDHNEKRYGRTDVTARVRAYEYKIRNGKGKKETNQRNINFWRSALKQIDEMEKTQL